jgi:hypothetical protein
MYSMFLDLAHILVNWSDICEYGREFGRIKACDHLEASLWGSPLPEDASTLSVQLWIGDKWIDSLKRNCAIKEVSSIKYNDS